MADANSWEIMEQKLTVAFRAVRATSVPSNDRIPTGSAAHVLAHQFLLQMYKVHKNPRLAVVTEKFATEQIKGVAERSQALLEALEQLSGTAESALNLNSGFLSKLTSQVRLLFEVSKQAEIPKLPPNTGMGAPKNIDAQRAADETACCYWFLTGEAPTASKPTAKGEAPYSEYLDLFVKVFNILGLGGGTGIKANQPATYAVNARKRWKEIRPQAVRQFGRHKEISTT